VIPLALWPYWPWIRKLWWLLPVTALAVTATTFRIQRDSAREDVADLTASLAAQDARYRAQVTYERQTTADTVRGLEAENARLRAAASGPVPVVRMCVGPVPAVPGIGTAAGGTGGTGAAGGFVPGLPDGTAADPFDYGPGLYAIADRADRCSAQVRHLLDRHRRLSALASEAE
jgi:hypothetical protein